jgi:CubicO group peptidase (beta-lactamase class C family)
LSSKRLGCQSLRIEVLPILALLVASSCTAAAGADDEIPTASPATLGFDVTLLDSGIEEFGSLSFSRGLLVLRDGKLVAEKYFHGSDAGSINEVRSITKSVLSALIGIALDQKKLKSVNEPLQDFFLFLKDDPKGKAILLKHLLTMSSGLAASDDDSDFHPKGQRDFAKYVLSRRIVTEPGAHFAYSTASAVVVGLILAKSLDMPMRKFAEKVLFEPLNVHVKWSQDSWLEIPMTSRDLAKFGLLYLNEGTYGGKRILPAKWVKESTSAQIQVGGAKRYQYGYFWWIRPLEPVPYYHAAGWGEQHVYVIPSRKLVIVMTNDADHDRSISEKEKIQTLVETKLIRSAKP